MFAGHTVEQHVVHTLYSLALQAGLLCGLGAVATDEGPVKGLLALLLDLKSKHGRCAGSLRWVMMIEILRGCRKMNTVRTLLLLNRQLL